MGPPVPPQAALAAALTLRRPLDGRPAARLILARHLPDLDFRKFNEGVAKGMETLLTLAVLNGDCEMVADVLGASGLAPDEQRNKFGATPLYMATQFDFVDVVELLLPLSDPNEGLPENEGSPLMMAAINGNVALMKLLLDRGARVDYLTKTYSGAMQQAAISGHPEAIELLISRGAWADQPSPLDRTTPLMYAALYGHEAAVAALLKAKACPNALNDNDGFALLFALKRGYMSIVQKLIDAGASLNLVRYKPHAWQLLFAAAFGDESWVESLLLNDPFIDVSHDRASMLKNEGLGCTPFLLASIFDYPKIATLISRAPKFDLEYEFRVAVAHNKITVVWRLLSMRDETPDASFGTCHICWEDLFQVDGISSPSCGHACCSSCHEQWVASCPSNPTCPICRNAFVDVAVAVAVANEA